MSEINLVPEEAKKTEDFDKVRSKIVIASVALLALTAIVAIVTLAFFGYFVSIRKDLISRVEEASATVNKYKSTEELLVVTKDKAAIANDLIDSRVDFLIFYGTLVEIIPQRVSFNNISVGLDAVTFKGKAASSAEVAVLVSALLSEKGSAIVSNVLVNSLVADQTREYTFDISAELNN